MGAPCLVFLGFKEGQAGFIHLFSTSKWDEPRLVARFAHTLLIRLILISFTLGWVQTNPESSFGINGIIYVHQLRISHFWRGIFLIGHD